MTASAQAQVTALSRCLTNRLASDRDSDSPELPVSYGPRPGCPGPALHHQHSPSLECIYMQNMQNIDMSAFCIENGFAYFLTYFSHIVHIVLHISCHILHIAYIFLVIFFILFCIFIVLFYILHIILHIY